MNHLNKMHEDIRQYAEYHQRALLREIENCSLNRWIFMGGNATALIPCGSSITAVSPDLSRRQLSQDYRYQGDDIVFPQSHALIVTYNVHQFAGSGTAIKWNHNITPFQYIIGLYK